MRTILLAIVVVAGIPVVAASQASAMPAEGAAIAGIAQQVDPVISVATKKGKKAQAQAKAPCPADQERSNRTGNCRAIKSER
jgi:hypothetical protein